MNEQSNEPFVYVGDIDNDDYTVELVKRIEL